MSVHEIRYRAYEGPISLASGRLFAIPKFSLQAVWGKVLTGTFFGLGGMLLLACTAYLFTINNPLIMAALHVGKVPEMEPSGIFQVFLTGQSFVAMIVMAAAGPKMISSELQHKALSLVYARPISGTAYVLGKFLGLASLVSILTWVQGLVLFVLMYALYPETHQFHEHFLSESLPLAAKTIVFGLSVSAIFPLVVLACSAATHNWRFCTGIFFGVLFGSSVISAVLINQMGHAWGMAGFWVLILQLDRALFGTGMGSELLTLPQVFIGFCLWCGAACLFLRWRLKPVDVYAE